jgi:hypothetical protein
MTTPRYLLPSQTETSGIGHRIRRAFRTWSARAAEPRPAFNTFFEHGHWWISVCDHQPGGGGTDRTFDVVDASGGDAVDGFSFEEV